MNKILYITPIFPQQRVVKTVDSLIRKGFEVTIIAYDIDLEKKYILDNNYNEKMEIISLKLKGKFKLLPFKSVLLQKKLKLLLKDSFDLIIFRDIFTFDLAYKIANKSHCKLVMDVADNYPEVMKSKFKSNKIGELASSLLNILERKSIKESYKVFTVTDSSKDLLSSKHSVDKNKFLVLKNYPNKINKKNKKNIKNIELVKLVYVGTVDESVRDLGTVFSYLKGTELKMDIYSSNKDLVIRLINKFEVKKNVRLLEPVKREVLPRILRNYEIGIIPHKLIPGTDYTIPNKLYDYIHSDLMILSTKNNAMTREIKFLGVGDTYSSKEDFINKINQLTKNKKSYIPNLELSKKQCKWEMQENIIMEMFNN